MPAEDLDDLPELDLDALEPVFEATAATRAANATVEIDADARIQRTAAARAYLNAMKAANAAKLLEALPPPGGSLHCIMRGHFNAWDLVPSVQRLARCPIRQLHIATLSFNLDNVARLVEMIDAGEVQRVAFLCASYMKSVEGDVFAHLHRALTERGSAAAAARSHAKLQLFDLDDGRQLTLEGSANLRSCRNVEQFTLTHDADLYAFHRTWIDELIAKATT
jgi:hypothetical protein